VAHAIPEFQTGAAGGFSSPFVTLQLGGQMFGDIVEAFSSSLEKIMAKNETEADLAAQQAEYQRRREEWQHELELLGKEKAQIEKRIAETQLKLEISSAELRRHDLEVENARKVQTYLRDKYQRAVTAGCWGSCRRCIFRPTRSRSTRHSRRSARSGSSAATRHRRSSSSTGTA
jgi:hypothetical protein